jgi:hypothetical protein
MRAFIPALWRGDRAWGPGKATHTDVGGVDVAKWLCSVGASEDARAEGIFLETCRRGRFDVIR